MALLVGLSALAPRLRLLYPLLLVPGLPAVVLSPDLVFFIFLPPLLSSESYQMSWHEFVANRRPIFLLAVGLVLLSTTVVAALAHYFISGFSWAMGFVLGAIISPLAARRPPPWPAGPATPGAPAARHVCRQRNYRAPGSFGRRSAGRGLL